MQDSPALPQAQELRRREAPRSQRPETLIEEVAPDAPALVVVLHRERDLHIPRLGGIGLEDSPHPAVHHRLEEELGLGAVREPIQDRIRGLAEEAKPEGTPAEAAVMGL